MRRITGRMIVRQAGFALRSLKDIGMAPSRGAHFTRMLHTLRHDPLELGLPWLPYDLIEKLEDKLADGDRVFEYGGGGSTAWFLERGADVTTIEHDAAWLEYLTNRLGESSRLHLLADTGAHDFATYVAAIDAFPDDHFDVVLVDGRHRVECFQHAIPKVKPGGWLVLDDVDRKRYRPVRDLVTWPREDIAGFAPCKPSLAYTSVFKRPITES